MKAIVENIDPLHAVIKVELPWDMILKELDEAYRDLGKKAEIKGFRKGKIPRNLLEKRFGKQVQDDVVSRIITDSYEEALAINRVKVVSKPELTKGKYEPGQPYQYTAKVEVYPTIEIKSIHVPVDKEKPEVKPEMLQESLEQLREQHAILTPIEGRDQAQSGDVAIVDYEAKQNGSPVDGGGEIKNSSVLIGSGKSVPGFEDQLIGMTIGQNKEFDLTFPKDWGMSRLAGQAVQFSVCLNAIKNRELPELGDEFVKDLGREGCDTLEVLKERLHEEILSKETDRIKQESRDKLIDGLIQANPFPVPPSMVNRQQDALAEEFENLLSMRGMAPEQVGLRRQNMKKELYERAVREVKAALLIDAIAEDQKITGEQKEIEETIEKIAAGSGKNVEQVKAWYSDPSRKQELFYKLRQEKALDYLLDLPHIDKENVGEKEKVEGLSETKLEERQPTTQTDPGEKV